MTRGERIMKDINPHINLHDQTIQPVTLMNSPHYHSQTGWLLHNPPCDICKRVHEDEPEMLSICCGAEEHEFAEGFCGACNEATGFEPEDKWPSFGVPPQDS